MAVSAPELPVVVAVTVVEQELETLAAVTTPVLLTVAQAVSEEVQLTLPVRFFVLPSLKLPVATSDCVLPFVIVMLEGVTVSEVSCGFTKNPRQPAASINKARTKTGVACCSFNIFSDGIDIPN